MQADEITIEAVAALNAVPAKKQYPIRGTTTLTGDGVKDLLTLLKDEIAAVTNLNGVGKVLANTKTAILTIKISIEVESADLS